MESRNIAASLGLRRLFFKYEGLNPTGSFKDRGMCVAVAKALEAGSKVLVCASTGNTSASAAAYAARCRMRAVVFIPSGEIALNKLSQALMYGAKVVALKGNFDRALATVRELADSYPVALVNSVNPYRIEGQKTAAFEIVDALGDAPDLHVLPVGNAGNISAYWMGYVEDSDAGNSTRLPKMYGFQASGAAPIVDGEVVCFDEHGRSSFRALQQRFHLKDATEVQTRMRRTTPFTSTAAWVGSAATSLPSRKVITILIYHTDHRVRRE